MKASQKNRELELISPLGTDVLLLHNFKGKEQLGRLFQFDLELRSTPKKTLILKHCWVKTYPFALIYHHH